MNPVAKFREITGTETIPERYASFVRTLEITAKEADSLAEALSEATPAEQSDFSLNKACSEASARMCAGVVVPELTPEQSSSSFAAMQRFANECMAKSKFVFTLYTPAPK